VILRIVEFLLWVFFFSGGVIFGVAILGADNQLTPLLLFIGHFLVFAFAINWIRMLR
jgi:hypothetical protein